ncbi:hypothetical protein [Kordiimonas aquimaris]|uniref:hypothetical protein n=1 Tax=Kordiimonas aquimaris TaxID=707591 RepID=UPI0021CE1021|nr:hypothetical protein [Kordiimonas aquimaris]
MSPRNILAVTPAFALAFGLIFVSACILSAHTLSAHTSSAQDSDAQKDAAQQSYDAIKALFGDKQAFERNFTAPLTSGSRFTTLDGKTSFNQRLSCPASNSYLELFYGIGSGGDLSPISVQQDTNFDGRYDWSVAFSNPVAGVCANGIITCNAGTFDNCASYRWSADVSTRLGLTEVGLAELAGCYCVNDSCGGNLAFSNRSTILDDLAGGMAGALMERDPRYAVSTVSREDFLIKLAGQDASACAPEPDAAQHEYFDTPTRLSSDAFAASSSDTIFGLVSNIPSGEGVLLTRNDCQIERQVTLEEVLPADIINRVTASTEYGEGTCAGDPDCFEFALGDDTDNHLVKKGCNIFTREIIWSVGEVERISEAVLTSATYEDQIHISLNGTTIFSTGGFNGVSDPSQCQIDDQETTQVNRSFRHALRDGTNRMLLKIAVQKRGSGQVRGRIRYRPGCELVETLDNTCASHASNQDCRLVDETVDGVRTWLKGGRTGVTPIAQTRTLYGAKCTQTFSRDWYQRDRTYECEASGAGARGFDFARSAHIYSNSAIDQFSDLRPGGDGMLQNYTGNYSFDAEYGIEACEKICKVSIDETDTEVSSSGVAGALLKNPITKKYTYHSCAGNVCPVGPGETIVNDCGCLNEFNDAVTVMQTFRLAGQDLTCTSGTRQALQ